MRRLVLAHGSLVGLLLLAGVTPLAGCVAPPSAPAPGHAFCPVCRCDGDLACLDVRIGPDTPTAVVDGTTYYFCSSECRDDFLQHLDRYARR